MVTGENHIVTASDATNGCNLTTLTLRGYLGIPTKDFTLNLMKTKANWSDLDVKQVSDYTDGYKITSTITLAGTGTTTKHQGTCFSSGDPIVEGGLCHVIKLDSASATTIAH